MKQFFLPLKVFVVGIIFLGLLMWLWPNTVDPAVTTLAASSNSTAWAARADAWGWSWLMSTGVVRYLVFGIVFLVVCFATGVTFLKQKTRF